MPLYYVARWRLTARQRRLSCCQPSTVNRQRTRCHACGYPRLRPCAVAPYTAKSRSLPRHRFTFHPSEGAVHDRLTKGAAVGSCRHRKRRRRSGGNVTARGASRGLQPDHLLRNDVRLHLHGIRLSASLRLRIRRRHLWSTMCFLADHSADADL